MRQNKSLLKASVAPKTRWLVDDPPSISGLALQEGFLQSQGEQYTKSPNPMSFLQKRVVHLYMQNKPIQVLSWALKNIDKFKVAIFMTLGTCFKVKSPITLGEASQVGSTNTTNMGSSCACRPKMVYGLWPSHNDVIQTWLDPYGWPSST